MPRSGVVGAEEILRWPHFGSPRAVARSNSPESRYNISMSTTPERHEFQTEVQQLLDLMVHSLYSHKDIFLRELISNASDALDKVRFEALTRPEILPVGELEIRLEPDSGARALTVHDNGTGMTRGGGGTKALLT